MSAQLPRVPSIFDDDFDSYFAHANISRNVGPPPTTKGTGFLYVVVNSNVVKGGTDVGKSVLLIKEKNGNWGPPGGMSDGTDFSKLHTGLREFSEEVGGAIDIRKLAAMSSSMTFVRIYPKAFSKASANESWALISDLSAQQVESTLFKDDRSQWHLMQRMSYKGPKDANGYAFVPIQSILSADNNGKVMLGKHEIELRMVQKTLQAIKNIP